MARSDAVYQLNTNIQSHMFRAPIRCRDFDTAGTRRFISQSSKRPSIVNDRRADCAARFTSCKSTNLAIFHSVKRLVT